MIDDSIKKYIIVDREVMALEAHFYFCTRRSILTPPFFPTPSKIWSILHCGKHSNFFRGADATCRVSRWTERLPGDFQFISPTTEPTSPPTSSAIADHSGPLPITAAGDRRIFLQINFYHILGVETHFLADRIQRAFEAKISKPPRYGFSQETLNDRWQIFKTACDTLSNPSSREEYNRGLIEDLDSTLTMIIPWDKIPGALCVLQEAGEAKTVIQVGINFLGEWFSKPFKQDVVLAIALAYVELSRDSMACKPPDFTGGCESLEKALNLLKEEGANNLASDLQAEIDKTLNEIAPRRALELLSLPLDESHITKRQDGLLCIRSILWTVGKEGATLIEGFTREDFMEKVFAHMTTSEQIDLFFATPNSIPAESFEVYGVALALVAHAITRKKPYLIIDADEHFRQLQRTKASRETDFALERGLCSLLNGELDECTYWLGLDDTSSAFRNQDMVEFITSNSNICRVDDFLPGLCKLLEIWIIEVVFSRFRDTRDLQFRLGDYFDDPTVLRYLKKMKGDGALPLAAAAAIAKIGSEASVILGCLKLSVRNLQKVLPAIKIGGDEALGMNFDRNAEENEIEASEEHHSGYLRVQNFKCFIKEERMKIICAGIAVGLLTLVGIKCFPKRRNGFPGKESGLAMAAGVERATNTSHNVEVLPKMDARYAESLVQKWQNIKSEALGPKHHVEKLPEVLDSTMLKVWTDRSTKASRQGWFLEYTLNGLTIESVTLSLDGCHAIVEATIKEAAKLINFAHPSYEDCYNTKYSMRYEIDCCGTVWKIVGGAVLKTKDSLHF